MEGPSHMHSHVMGVTRDIAQHNARLSQGLIIWNGWLAPEGSIACVEGYIGCVVLVPPP